jgi:hypothetical protein
MLLPQANGFALLYFGAIRPLCVHSAIGHVARGFALLYFGAIRPLCVHSAIGHVARGAWGARNGIHNSKGKRAE